MYKRLLSCPWDVVWMTKKVQEAAVDLWATLEVEAKEQSLPANVGDQGEDEQTWHSPAFDTVRWYGKAYTFTPNEAACVRVLWEYQDRGVAEVSWKTIRIEAKTSAAAFSTCFGRRKKTAGYIIRPGIR